MNNPKPLETLYRGCRFRSRLEARWAIYFDVIGVEWDYELEGFGLGDAGWYLPDFWLSTVNMWAEVKPRPLNQREHDACLALSNATGNDCLMLIGTPDIKAYWGVQGWDYLLTEEYLDEHRFFTATGEDEGINREAIESWPLAVEAYVAARSARFDAVVEDARRHR